MWVALDPMSGLLWTQSGLDLLAYRSVGVVAGGGPLHSVARLAGAAPAQLSGAAWLGGRLYASAQPGPDTMQLWSIDLTTGARQLETEQRIAGEAEGLAAYQNHGGELHWLIAPGTGSSPTYGSTTSVLLHLAPKNSQGFGKPGRLAPIKLAVAPRRPRAGRRATIKLTARATIVGRAAAAAGVEIRVRGKSVFTDDHGRARARIKAPKRGRLVVKATRRGLTPATVKLRLKR